VKKILHSAKNAEYYVQITELQLLGDLPRPPTSRSFVSDIAIFVLKRDVKLQLTSRSYCRNFDPLAVNPFASVYGYGLVMTSVACQTPGGPGSRGTDSWLDDIDKNFGPDLPLLSNMHEIWSVDAHKNY